MAKGQHYSAHQRKIINRYYEHKDTIALNRLSEIVSDLYLCTTEKKAATLWKSAATFLANAGASPEQVRKVTAARDVKALAVLITELQGGGTSHGRG